MAKGKNEKPINPNNQLSDSDTLDDESINPIIKTLVEERHYGTIPGLALATQAALSHSWAQENPTVKREDPAIQKELKCCQEKELLISPHKLITKRNKSK